MRSLLLTIGSLVALFGSLDAQARTGRVAVIAVPASAELTGAATLTRNALESGLKARQDAEPVDLWAVAGPDEAQTRARAEAQGRKALQDALRRAEEYKLEAAQRAIAVAVSRLEEANLRQMGIDPLLEALVVSAVISERQGRLDDARQFLVRVFTLQPSYVLPESRRTPQFSKLVSEAKSQVSNLERTRLTLRSSPAGAAVFMDGRFAGVTPLEGPNVVVGSHYVTVMLPGYSLSQERIPVEPNGKVSMPLQPASNGQPLLTALGALEPSAMTASHALPASTTAATVRALAQWASADEVLLVRVSGTPERLELHAERWTPAGVSLTRADQKVSLVELTSPQAVQPLLESLVEGAPWSWTRPADSVSRGGLFGLSQQRTWAMVSGGAAVALAAGGTTFGLKANRQASDARAIREALPNDAAAYDSARSKARQTALVADVLFAGALVGAVTGGILWFTDSPTQTPPPAGQVSLSLLPTTDGAAATLSGRF